MWNSFIQLLFEKTPLLYWTQSLWRDEAYSVWIAQDSLSEVIRRTSGDFNPPLYYLLLHFWLRQFGISEMALRGLSAVFFILFLFVVYSFSKKIFRSKSDSVYTTLLMAVNPMLLYFAFELRMYSLLILLATTSMYFFYTRKWLWYIVLSALGMYTQPFMVFVILAQCLYLFVTKKIATLVKNSISISLLYVPWLPVLFDQFRHSGPMWMYPVNLTLIVSVLGNLYIGYEGTPGNLWTIMQLISLLILLAGSILWGKKTIRPTSLLLYCWMGVPTVLVFTISLVKPIYVHRYLIFVTVAEVFIISLFLSTIQNKFLKKWLWIGVLFLTFAGSFFVAPVFHQKINIRKAFSEINPRLKLTDLIYAQTPLVFYESLYYAPAPNAVFLYNPNRITLPRYVGSIGMPQSKWATTIPQYPKRAFIVYEDGTYTINSLFVRDQ